jgi:hypothetical protein
MDVYRAEISRVVFRRESVELCMEEAYREIKKDEITVEMKCYIAYIILKSSSGRAFLCVPPVVTVFPRHL